MISENTGSRTKLISGLAIVSALGIGLLMWWGSSKPSKNKKKDKKKIKKKYQENTDSQSLSDDSMMTEKHEASFSDHHVESYHILCTSNEESPAKNFEFENRKSDHVVVEELYETIKNITERTRKTSAKKKIDSEGIFVGHYKVQSEIKQYETGHNSLSKRIEEENIIKKPQNEIFETNPEISSNSENSYQKSEKSYQGIQDLLLTESSVRIINVHNSIIEPKHTNNERVPHQQQDINMSCTLNESMIENIE